MKIKRKTLYKAFCNNCENHFCKKCDKKDNLHCSYFTILKKTWQTLKNNPGGFDRTPTGGPEDLFK